MWISITGLLSDVIRGQSRGQTKRSKWVRRGWRGLKSAAVGVYVCVFIFRWLQMSKYSNFYLCFTNHIRLKQKLFFFCQPKTNIYCKIASNLKVESDWLESTLVMSEEKSRRGWKKGRGEKKGRSSKGTGLYITNIKKMNIEFLFMIFYSVTITNVAYLYLPTCCRATV